jgi:hypothetical protein
MALKDRYLNLITNQHRDKPKYMAMLSVLLQPSEDVFNTATYLDDEFDIDNAQGAQLDILGVILGQSRQASFLPSGLLDDTGYRLLLKAKIIKNHWKGQLPALLEAWNTLFPDNHLYVYDNQDMTLRVGLQGDFSEIERELILNGYIVPKPQTVGINFFHFGDSPNPIYNLNLYTGARTIQRGKRRLGISIPGDMNMGLWIGGTIQISGKKIFNISFPTKATVHSCIRGFVHARGKIILKVREES